MAIKRTYNDIVRSEQTLLKRSIDDEFEILATEGLGYDGQNLQRLNGQNLAMKVTRAGDIIYMAFSAPGTTEATAKWQCKKIDASSGVTITWADGNANYDNAATDLTALTYS